jgi:lipoprotein-anchoring transpeptidase ErfK/SrfK
VLFSSHLLCFEHFLFSPHQVNPTARVETIHLTHAVKNAWRKCLGEPAFGTFAGIFPDRRERGESGTRAEKLMSMRIAVALVATIGAGLLMTGAAKARPEMVGLRGEYSPGTIVVKTNERHLYLILDQDHAMRYPVGVGKAGKQWAGTTRIDGKYQNPAWAPPSEVKHDKPNIPDLIPGGSPRNPMGVAAMTLAGGEYAIHGTNMPGSVGGFVSYGCIRMLNADISDLYQRVSVGTTVVVTR